MTEEEQTQTQAEYTKPTTQVDLEERLARERGEELPGDVGRDFSGGRSAEELDAFVGVDPVYRNFADETSKPLFADSDSAEGEFEKRHTDASDRIIIGATQDELDAWEADAKAFDDAEELETSTTAPSGDHTAGRGTGIEGAGETPAKTSTKAPVIKSGSKTSTEK